MELDDLIRMWLSNSKAESARPRSALPFRREETMGTKATIQKDLGDEIYSGLGALVSALRDLGVGNADTRMGALELHAKEVRDGFQAVRNGLHEVSESNLRIARAVNRVAEANSEIAAAIDRLADVLATPKAA